ncbi:MAG: helix-turn-helix transcriptional regulator [Armatimonadetes bacterium]|nr:helix-turn-helix transcriptional regulator [Armatimonadota bacterium]
MAVADVFRALGDPIRLEMVQRLSRSRRQKIAALSNGLGITRQGARRHLQVLADAELVRLEPSGRDVWVELDPISLDRARGFIAELERQWDVRLEALKRSIEGEPPSE